MFNKTILVALILCVCYLSTIEARPQLEIVTDVVKGAAGGVTGGAGKAIGETVAGGALGSVLPGSAPSIPIVGGLTSGLTG